MRMEALSRYSSILGAIKVVCYITSLRNSGNGYSNLNSIYAIRKPSLLYHRSFLFFVFEFGTSGYVPFVLCTDCTRIESTDPV